MSSSSIGVRGLAAIAAACAFLCLGAANASAAPLVWASNFGEDTVSTFDSATGQAVGTAIPVPDEPESIAITPNGRRAVVISDGKASATVIETATRTPVKTLALGSAAGMVAISPDGRRAFVTLGSSGEIAVIDPGTGNLLGSFPVGVQPRSVAFSPGGTKAYVGLGTEEIAVLDAASGGVVGKPIPIGAVATSIVFTPDGETAYATSNGLDEVKVIDVALGEVVKSIPVPPASQPHSLAVSPDGRHLYLGSIAPPSLTVIETAGDRIVGEPIALPVGPNEIAVTPDGSTAFVAGGEVVPVNLATGLAGPPFGAVGNDVMGLAVTPDQSPTAAFSAPLATAGTPALFSGAASSDPDGTIVSWSWGFGDGGTATGIGPSHTFTQPGAFVTRLTVVDNEGCGARRVFTGRTSYCSGNEAASVTRPVTVNAPATPIAAPAPPPSNNFRFGRVVHNLRNGTVRLQVTLPSAGFVLLFGKKVHAVTRKSKGLQKMWLTLHARVELAKRLKTTLRAPVKFRVTFTPNGGTPKTAHKAVTLQRAPRHKHRH